MRKTSAKKKILLPDPRFGNTTVTRFVNNLMVDGKKNVAEKLFYSSFNLIGKREKNFKPIEVFICACSIYLFLTFLIHNFIKFAEKKMGTN